MLKAVCIGMLAGHVAGAAVPDVVVEEKAEVVSEERGRELFPLYAVGTKCAHKGCTPKDRAASRAPAAGVAMSISDATKGPTKALEMLAMNDDLNTVVQSGDFCTRRHAMARAAGLAAGLALSQVKAPSFAAETKAVKMGSDSGQLVFVPDEIKICAGDSVTWTNNKGGPHNVVFDEEAVPDGVDTAKISMEDQLGEEGDTFSKKFDVKGTYNYYCEPHRGAGMNAQLIVS
jgi:plastocyanin